MIGVVTFFWQNCSINKKGEWNAADIILTFLPECSGRDLCQIIADLFYKIFRAKRGQCPLWHGIYLNRNEILAEISDFFPHTTHWMQIWNGGRVVLETRNGIYCILYPFRFSIYPRFLSPVLSFSAELPKNSRSHSLVCEFAHLLFSTGLGFRVDIE